MKRSLLSIALALLLTGFGVPSALAQQQPQQEAPRRMQQHMEQMQDHLQRMNRVMDRTHRLSQEMHRRMQQTQDDATRRQYQYMQRMCDDLTGMAGQMKNLAERHQQMLQNNPDLWQDRGMQRDVDRMRRHLRDMTDQMEGATQTIERMRDRVREHQTSN